MKPQVLAVAVLAAVLMTPSVQARTFEMTGIGQDIHFEKNLLQTCAIGDPRSCKTQLVKAADVVPLDDKWYLIVVDSRNYYSCTINYCEPHPTSDADRGWQAKGAFNLNESCYYDLTEGLNCTQAEPFRRPSQLIFADIFRTGKPQALSLAQGLLCDTDGGACRTTSGLGLLASATRIAALVATFVPRVGLVAVDPSWQTACRYATSTATTIGFSCSQAAASDAPALFEPWLAGTSVVYVPLPTTTPMAHPDANGNPQPTDNAAIANVLDTSFGKLNATTIGTLYVPQEEHIQMFTIDVPAMTAAQPPPPPPPTWTKIADESQPFTVSGTQTVRFGSEPNWITLNVTDAGTCSNVFFGNDPYWGVLKECDVQASTPPPPPPTTWTRLAGEGQPFTVSGTQSVRYGSGTSWITRDVTGTGTCSNEWFGNDPLPGIVKECDAQAAGSSTTWTKIVDEGQPFTVSNTQTVRYGKEPNWLTLSVTGNGMCTNSYFGSDPIYGIAKECDLMATVPLAAGMQLATMRDARTEGVTANQSTPPPPAGTAYTFKWFSDQTIGKWPTFNSYDECFVPAGANGPECGHGDNRKAAGEDIINRYNFPGILCPWIGTWQKVDETTGLFSITSACQPSPTYTYPTYSIVTPKPMTRDQCLSQCNRIATVGSNYCAITTAQIAGVSVGLTVLSGVAAGVAFTAAAGPVAGVEAGVAVGKIFGTAVGGVTIGYGALCGTLNSNRQNQCIQITCGG